MGVQRQRVRTNSYNRLVTVAVAAGSLVCSSSLRCLVIAQPPYRHMATVQPSLVARSANLDGTHSSICLWQVSLAMQPQQPTLSPPPTVFTAPAVRLAVCGSCGLPWYL